jgi:hypothetical protein
MRLSFWSMVNSKKIQYNTIQYNTIQYNIFRYQHDNYLLNSLNIKIMKRYLLLLVLAVVPALAMAQSEKTNKGAHYLEVKTGLSISDATSFSSEENNVKGMSFDMRYAYGLINNLDVVAAFTTYNGYQDIDPFVDPMYYSNALQIGVKGKVKCFDFMNLKLSLTGGLVNHAQTKYSYSCAGNYVPYTNMYLAACLGGMFEVDFDISERVSLGLFYGRTSSIVNAKFGYTFDNTGLSLSVRL